MSRLHQVNDYISNNLLADEIDAFEMQLLTDSELQAEVELQLKLKRALKNLSHTDSETHVVDPLPVSASVYAQKNLVKTVYVETMRGNTTKVEIFNEPTHLAIDVGPASGQSFTANIQQAQTIVHTELIQADDEGHVNLTVPALATGIYDCRVFSTQTSKTLTLSVVEK